MATSIGFREFRIRMGKLAEGAVSETRRVVREAALILDQAVVNATPVDTGRARSNWIVTLDFPAEVVPNNITKDNPISLDAATQASLLQGAPVIAAYQDGSIYVSNNVHYIEKLDRGSSAQAPAGMSQQAIGLALIHIRAATINIARRFGG